MHQVSFYPVNNGDSCQIVLNNGKRILLDYRQHANASDKDKPEIDLAAELKSELDKAGKDYFDVVAFTHADKDHIEGSTEFFELRHAQKYQGDDRVGIAELWVPAAMLIESSTLEERSEEFVILRQEARYRLREARGIRIFSRPPELLEWMKTEKIDVDSRSHLFVDAGTLVPTFSLGVDDVEFFCHSPFIKHVEGGGKEVRNAASLIFNVRFQHEGDYIDFLATGDSDYKTLEDIVSITRKHNNEDRLAWDLFNLPHHCSYLTLSDEKGEKETIPNERVKELLLAGRKGSYIISSSQPIRNNREAELQTQPPHIQAKRCYDRYLKQVEGRKLLVTMEEPNESKPKPLVFELSNGVSLRNNSLKATPLVTTTRAGRAG